MRKSRLSEGGTNLFQRIKAQCAEAEKRGVTIIRLSIGQPSGPALESARKAAAQAVMSLEESMHEYQDNGSPGVPNFAKRFVQAHIRTKLETVPSENISFLPIPGIKPMLGLIPMACGAINGRPIMVSTTTEPGYPTPVDWCRYLRLSTWHQALPTNPENQFLFSRNDILSGITLLMLNYPHNPSGQAATFEWWTELCAYCQLNNVRLFNDAAYAVLAHDKNVCALTDVAFNFKDLSWAEAFSASKAIGNGTGWRVGAICGSPDFVGNIATIKGNTDSGFFAPAAAGALYALENDRESIEACRKVYEDRIKFLIRILSSRGMRLAVEPKAGFFTLWLSPKEAFGQKIKDGEEFNNLMIQNTGIAGVPFGQYIRYAVTGPVEKWEIQINRGFLLAKVSY